MTDAELIQGCKRGDREAQHELYIRTSERIYGLLLRMTRNPDAAFDLAQDAYLRAFGRIGQFNGDSSLGTWLYRIAVNEALQFMRRKGTRAHHADVIPLDASATNEGDHVTTRMDVKGALDRLDEADRTILVLRYQDGLDYREIADVLDCATGTVASRLNRARDRLRQILGGGYGISEEMAKAKHLTDAE